MMMLSNIGQMISIHALREEGDHALPSLYSTALKFLSTPSVRRATLGDDVVQYWADDFYPRPP